MPNKSPLATAGCLLAAFLMSVPATSLAGGNGQEKKMSLIKRIVRGFSAIDTNYIEPQHYNFTAMVQTTFNYDIYRLKGNSGQTVTLSPDIAMKLGPYFGWKWFFLGYTFDLRHFGFSDGGRKREVSFSIYSSQIGIDLFYRRTGSDYKIRDAHLGDGIDASRLDNVPFDGINVGITGASVYYVFNHERFSYPAAFAQSTCQKVSCGSWLAGIGFTSNSIDLDHKKLQRVVAENCHPQEVKIDSGLMFRNVEYSNVSLSCGYAYNWVFARNFLFCASASLALSYKHSRGYTAENIDRGFNFKNVNIDCMGRFGLVYNNTRWYAGASAILNSYNYHKSRFATNNTFGSLNVYIGYNFGLKERYKKQKR